MNMECSLKNSPTYVASMCSERLKIKMIIASNIEYMVVFLTITVMSNRRSFMIAIPIKAPKMAVSSMRVVSMTTYTMVFVSSGVLKNIVRIKKAITKRLIRVYKMWRRAKGDVSRRRALNKNQHENKIKTRPSTLKRRKITSGAPASLDNPTSFPRRELLSTTSILLAMPV